MERVKQKVHAPSAESKNKSKNITAKVWIKGWFTCIHRGTRPQSDWLQQAKLARWKKRLIFERGQCFLFSPNKFIHIFKLSNLDQWTLAITIMRGTTLNVNCHYRKNAIICNTTFNFCFTHMELLHLFVWLSCLLAPVLKWLNKVTQGYDCINNSFNPHNLNTRLSDTYLIISFWISTYQNKEYSFFLPNHICIILSISQWFHAHSHFQIQKTLIKYIFLIQFQRSTVWWCDEMVN